MSSEVIFPSAYTKSNPQIIDNDIKQTYKHRHLFAFGCSLPQICHQTAFA